MKLEQVSPSTWAITDGSTYGNVGCIELSDRVVVIDTGMAPSLAKDFRQLVQKQVGDQITDVILTHYHSDHIFGAQIFHESRLIASTRMAEEFTQRLKDMWSPQGIEELKKFYAQNEPQLGLLLNDLKITPPNFTFDHSMTIGDDNEIQILHTGGHTAGHSMVYFTPEQILFAGDLVFSQSYPYAGDPTNDPQQWMKVFEEILEMSLQKIVPGHGPLCNKDEIRRHLSYFEELEAWIRRKLGDKISLEELLEQVEDGPKYPYKLKAERRLESTITRWYQFFLKANDTI